MRTTLHWMLLLSALLFVASIWFVIAGVRNSRSAPAAAPVATVKQIMQGIVTPASSVVYGSVSTVITAEGTKETAPQTDAEWARVGSNATALIEAARLLMEPSRAKNTDEWMKMSQAMIDGSARALKATTDKNAEGLLAAGEAINMSCDRCHREYAANLDL